MYRVLISARMFGLASDEAYKVFERKGYEIVHNPYKGKGLTEEQLLELIPGVDAIITGVDNITKKVIEAADKLKVISKCGVGVDNIDIEAATKKGIKVTTTPGTNPDSVADMAFALMLTAARRITDNSEKVRKGGWPLTLGTEVWGKTLGIIGLGNIGQRVAIRAKGFGMKIIAFEKYPNIQFIEDNKVSLAELDDLLRESDFITIHVPSTKETENIINKEKLSLMKSTAFLVNTSRGGVINEEDLYNTLKEGKIRGAAVDVLKQEPPKDSKLMTLDNFIATSHISAFTYEAIKRSEDLSSQNIFDILEGKGSPYLVNK